MPSSRTQTFKPSTLRRQNASSKIKTLGYQLFDMGRCSACQNGNSLCFVLKGYSKCSSCVKKNIRCDGKFSEVEFEALDQRKREVQSRAQEKRAEVGRLAAAAAAAYTALAEAQREEAELQDKVDRYAETQSRMLRQELNALDELEESRSSELPVGVLSDGDFVWDDSEMVLFLQEPGGTVGQGQG